MPKKTKILSPLAVRRLRREGLHNVGGVFGLHLLIRPSGSKYWVLRVMVGGRRRDIGLGSYPEVSLAMARENGAQLRQQIREGFDPLAERQARREALRAHAAKSMTFAACMKRYLANKTKEFRNAKHAAQWHSSLETYALPVLGDLSVDRIELGHVVRVLEPIWTDKTETATRVRQRIEKVLDYARVSGWCSGENPARWRGNLDAVLPKPAKVKKIQHFRALPFSDVPAFMAKLRRQEGIAARALEFAILTAARSGEVRGATWGEIDLDAQVWTIPGERMKAGKDHVVPLAPAALAILKAVPRMKDSNQVFPAARGGALSDMALAAVLRRMEVDSTAHGFRSSFKDWARNLTTFADEVSELALAHVSSDATRAAYARDGLIEQWRALLTEWAEFCSKPKAQIAQVILAARATG